LKDSALIIFVKNPVLGKVKTRLAKTIGDEAALAAYLHLLEVTRDIALGTNSDTYIFYSDSIDHDDLWQGRGFTKMLQRGDDLGQRMAHAFTTVLQSHQHVAIIGSDCGDLTSTIIERAFYSLKETDIVVGPSHDGGYYLLGMNEYQHTLFEHIEWSTDQVFKATLQRALQAQLSVTELMELSDIDHELDWLRYQAKRQ